MRRDFKLLYHLERGGFEYVFYPPRLGSSIPLYVDFLSRDSLAPFDEYGLGEIWGRDDSLDLWEETSDGSLQWSFE